MKKFGFKSALGAALLALVGSANALTVYFNSTPVSAFGSPSFGSIVLTQNGTAVDVSVSLNAGFDFVGTGAGNDNIFMFNGINVSVGDIQNIKLNDGTPAAIAISPSQTSTSAGAYGQFDFGIRCSPTTACRGGDDKQADPLTFTVLDATIADLTSSFSSKGGAYFAADVITQGATGLIAVTELTPPIPEPETYALMLAGLGAVGFMARRRKAAALKAA